MCWLIRLRVIHSCAFDCDCGKLELSLLIDCMPAPHMFAIIDQLMLDTLKSSSHFMPHVGAAAIPTASRHDDELLRQQEAFINQNRMHIEKRRHERSPERDHRDRSYTPPPPSGAASSARRGDRRPYSRERELGPRKVAPASTGGLSGGTSAGSSGSRRRAGSREKAQHVQGNVTANKRRKSSSPERRQQTATAIAGGASAKTDKVNELDIGNRE